MNFWKKINKSRQSLFRKHRFVMLDATTNEQEWRIHLSPASIWAGFLAFVLVLFIVLLCLMAYTPILEILPGYRTETDHTRESLVQNIMRLDSMERAMNDMLTYNENISLIMEGKTPVARTYTDADTTRTGKNPVLPSTADSILRREMEGEGIYSLNNEANSRRKLREMMSLSVPAEGIITKRFDIAQNHFGVGMAVGSDNRIVAIDKGTVIQTLWTPENGYVVFVQHGRDMVSVYKNLAQTLVTTGQTVKRSDQIGYSPGADTQAEPQAGVSSREDPFEPRLFEFELWNNGKPVDPEDYIPF